MDQWRQLQREWDWGTSVQPLKKPTANVNNYSIPIARTAELKPY
jgi:hypothetical protein